MSLEARSCCTRTRIGNTRARINRNQETDRAPCPSGSCWAISSPRRTPGLSRLFEAGTIAAATRLRLQRRLDLEIARLTEEQR